MAGEQPGPDVGRPVSPELEERLKSLRAIVGPEAGMKRVEDYARWLTGGAALIGGLLAVFVNSSLVTLDSWGYRLLALSMLFLAGSLACAASVLAPVWGSYNPNSVESMESRIQNQYNVRRPRLKWGTALLTLALLAAGVAPSASGLFGSRSGNKLFLPMTYVMSADGRLKAVLHIEKAQPGTVFELELKRLTPRPEVIARSRGVADSSGTGSVTLEASGLRGGTFRLSSACQHLPDPALRNEQEIELPIQPQLRNPRSSQSR